MRCINIENCNSCPNKSHGGGFGQIAYIPRCDKARKELPYTKGVSGNMIVATCTGEIPKWCPLEPKEPSMTKLGVGDGTGELFVQGDYDSIKACQQKLLDLEKYRQLFFAAIEYIDKSPCDPDITTEQAEAWLRLQTLLAKRNEGIKS